MALSALNNQQKQKKIYIYNKFHGNFIAAPHVSSSGRP